MIEIYFVFVCGRPSPRDQKPMECRLEKKVLWPGKPSVGEFAWLPADIIAKVSEVTHHMMRQEIFVELVDPDSSPGDLLSDEELAELKADGWS